MMTILKITVIIFNLVLLMAVSKCVSIASRHSRSEELKEDPFKILYRSNVIQFDEMGYPLRLCVATGNGRINPEQVWLDTLEEDGDVVLKFTKMEYDDELNKDESDANGIS